MSSDEDFSLVPDDHLSNTLKKIQKEIERLKVEQRTLEEDKQFLIDAKNSNVKFTQDFQKAAEDVKKRIETTKRTQAVTVRKVQEKLAGLKQEQMKLKMEISETVKELDYTDETQKSLKQQTEVSTAVPEKKVVFKGEMADGTHAPGFDIQPRVVYPMEEGTALITFEEEQVANKLLALKKHEVQLGDCSITVQAEPVQFLVPTDVSMDTNVCPRRVLVSNLPKSESTERILDKLEIHFSKTKNKGGEVDEVVLLEDSGNVVITFTDNNIASVLTNTPMHEIEIERGKKHKVKVTPFLNGEITLLKTGTTSCSRTVLLTGIPAVMDKDSLQDLLEIHFQKSTNSGGEVDAIVYNPAGERTLAVFEEDSPQTE
ncbi:interferon-induced protein 35 [Trichomycterus rosablanca]|uniref:interferon-induced protein 35 n=1 Tax=Trichomycterus rosablanca TaxID=2290929 RepID=UPI002F359FB7